MGANFPDESSGDLPVEWREGPRGPHQLWVLKGRILLLSPRPSSPGEREHEE